MELDYLQALARAAPLGERVKALVLARRMKKGKTSVYALLQTLERLGLFEHDPPYWVRVREIERGLASGKGEGG